MEQPRIFRLSGDYDNPSYIVDDVPMLTANPMSDRVPLVYDSSPPSPASEASTSDSSGPVCASCGNAKPTRTGEKCCDPTGPMSPATTPWKLYESTQEAALESASFAADSPAKTSPSPDDGQDSPARDRPSSSSSHESPTLFAPPGSSLRMFPDYFPPTVAEISPSFTRRWPSSGMGWPGESWTLDTSECPNGAVESSLSDILEPEVPSRFFLSSKAARGILRRAEKRGRQLPSHLSAALEAVARMTTTGREGD